MSSKTGLHVEAANSAQEVVEFADVLICATTSTTPVLEENWVKPGTHVNTIGPKFRGKSEVPYELAQKSQVIVTDSFQQVDGYSEPFFLSDTPERKRMIELSDVVAGKQKGRQSSKDITLFCSVGLAGTEVVVANEALNAANSA
jgi:ornithine cyclodeaminase